LKKIISVLLALAVLISLVACSEDKEVKVKWYSHEQMQEICDPIVDSIIDSVNDKDDSSLKEHYSESALANDEDFAGGFSRLCDYVSGNIESYTYKNGQTVNNKEDEKSETDIYVYYVISLSDGSEYEIGLTVRVVDEIGDTDSELGLSYLVISADDCSIGQPDTNSCIIINSQETESAD